MAPLYVLSGDGRPKRSARANAVCAIVRVDLEDQVIADGPCAEGEFDGPHIRDPDCEYVYAIDFHCTNLLKVSCR